MADKPLEEQQTPFLLRLPPSLLRLVLLDPLKPISFKNFIICKTLLPYTLEALYNHVSLVKRGSFAKFDACTKARPAVIELIKSFTVETRCLSKESTSLKSPRRPPADLLDLMFNLPNLKVLVLGSKETAREVLLDPRQSTADLDAAWPRLRQVTLQITRIYSDVLSYTSSLGALKNLKHLSLGPHSRLVPAELVKLLPPTLPRLHSIASQLCTCPAETLPPRTRCSIPGTKEGTADPETRRWVEEGEALLRKAAQTGVEIEGELRCSLGMCRVTKEHEAVCVGNGL
ncbi:hypothetical protein JCM8097_003456 [Rhodosporidiobolus ruineniae]